MSSASEAVQDFHSWAGGRRRILDAIGRDSPPERRTTPMPARPGGVEIATMVSRVCTNTGGRGGDLGRHDHRVWADHPAFGLGDHRAGASGAAAGSAPGAPYRWA